MKTWSSIFFNTDCHITIYDDFNEAEIFPQIEEIFRSYQETFNVFDPASEISRFNNYEAGKIFVASPFFYYELNKVTQIAEKFPQFSPSVETLHHYYRNTLTWRYREIAPLVKAIKSGYQMLGSYHIMKGDKLLRINFHSSLKGRVSDVIKDFLYDLGLRTFLIDLGGNVLVEGLKPTKDPWRIGIANPQNPRYKPLLTVDIYDKSVVTCGNYERPLILNDINYGHIINPQTGYFLNSQYASITVISQSSIECDIISTICYFYTIHEIEALAKQRSLKIVVIDHNNNYLTFGG